MKNLKFEVIKQGTNTLKHGVYVFNGDLYAGYYTTENWGEPQTIDEIINNNFVPQNTGFMHNEDFLNFSYYLNYNDFGEDEETNIRCCEFNNLGCYGSSEIYYPRSYDYCKNPYITNDEFNKRELEKYNDSIEANIRIQEESEKKVDNLLNKEEKEETEITPPMKKRYYEVLKEINSMGIPINFDYFEDIFENEDKETYITSYSRGDFVGYYIDFESMFDDIFHQVVNAEGNHQWDDTIYLDKIQRYLDNEVYQDLCSKIESDEEI